jgi:hypothetical protein
MKKCESTRDQVNSKKGIVEEDDPEDEKRLQAQAWGVGSRNAKVSRVSLRRVPSCLRLVVE